jgi:hypothetical protein
MGASASAAAGARAAERGRPRGGAPGRKARAPSTATRPGLIAALRAADSTEATLRCASAAAADGELTPAAASAALQRLSALAPRGGAALRADARFGALSAYVAYHTAALRPRTLANVVFAFGALGAPPDAEWLRRAEAASAPALPAMCAEDAANLVWGLVVCGHRPGDAWLRAWGAAWGDRIAEASAAAAAAVASGAALGAADTGAGGAAPAPARVHPQAIERALWACGTLAFNPGAEVLAASAAAAAAVARAAPPGALAHTLWALAVLRAPAASEAVADLAAAVAAKFGAASVGELVTTFWVRPARAHCAPCARATPPCTAAPPRRRRGARPPRAARAPPHAHSRAPS